MKIIDHAVFLLLSGDNILTAVNVARACGMVLSHEKVIFVHASPPTASSVASLQFHQGDGAVATTDTQDTIDISAQVCLFDLLSALQILPLIYHVVMSYTEFLLIQKSKEINLFSSCTIRVSTRTVPAIIWL